MEGNKEVRQLQGALRPIRSRTTRLGQSDHLSDSRGQAGAMSS